MMGRKKKKAERRDGAGSERRRARARSMLWLLVAAGFACATAFGLKALEAKVLKPSAAAARAGMIVRVRLVDLPVWMPGSLANHIASSLVPRNADFNDANLVQTVYDQAQNNPWVRQVKRVHKQYTDDPIVGVLEIQSEYRMPLAKVALKDSKRFAYVDRDGVRLPEDPALPGAPTMVVTLAKTADREERKVYYSDKSDVPPGVQAERMHYIVIEGVQSDPPAPGGLWKGDDLADGLKLIHLVLSRTASRKYANQITSVDVRNFAGRVCAREPHLRMHAVANDGARTDIRFGRFPLPEGDYVVEPERRMKYLDDYVADHGGLAGYNQWIDLRGDGLHFSKDQTPIN